MYISEGVVVVVTELVTDMVGLYNFYFRYDIKISFICM